MGRVGENRQTQPTESVKEAGGTSSVPPASPESEPAKSGRSEFEKARARAYPYSFYVPAGVVYTVLFLVPTALAFFFSLTRWTLFDWEYIGLDNFRQFFNSPALTRSMTNTIVYAVVTSGLKVIIGLPLAVLLTSRLRLKSMFRSMVFFPVLVSTVAVGITFRVLLHPSNGLVNKTIELLGVNGPGWLTDPSIALLSVALVDVWKGVGIAMVIFIAGILSIPEEYREAVKLDGGAWADFWHVIVPLSRNATFTVILLSFVTGLRTFDLIWTMTRGGPGFTSDVLASTIYKQYQAGFYGLSTAGNVILFLGVVVVAYPMMAYFNRKEIEL